MQYDVFICYKRTSGDKLAERLREALKDYQITAFVDEFDIPKECKLTDKWWQYRDQAIVNCKTFVKIITIGFEKSQEIIGEIQLANDNQKKFMCFRWANLKPEILINLGDRNLNMKDAQQIEFYDPSDLVRQFFDCYGKQSSVEEKKENFQTKKVQPLPAYEENRPPIVNYGITINTEHRV